jgi:electron transport complex protein RnfD
MSLPPWAPWWFGVLGGVFAIVIGKQIFGGLGQNVFNPAMLARVALLISFPLEMTQWVMPPPLFAAAAPDFMEGLRITFLGAPNVDAVSGATLLGHVKTELGRGTELGAALAGNFHWASAGLGIRSGSFGETSALLVLLGGIYLIARRIITWHIPVAMLGAVALPALVMNMLDPAHYPDAVYHLLTGGVMLGAFFIATDYVTSPSSPSGQIIYGAGCGLLVWIIRTFGGYPEGVAFAVLIMNAMTPLIDHWVRPRIYGRDRKGAPLAYGEKKP